MQSTGSTIKDILENTKLNNPLTIQRSWMEYFQTKNFLILLLITVILLLFLGINIISVIAYIFQMIVYALKPLISSILLLFGVSINTVGDLFDSAGNIVDSVLHVFGNGIQKISKYPSLTGGGGGGNNGFGDWSNGGGDWSNGGGGDWSNGGGSGGGSGTTDYFQPSDTNFSTQQSNMSQNKQKWCLIGNTPGSKTCIPIEDSTKCMSGMTYDDEQTCMNPTTTEKNPMTQTTSGNGNLSGKQNATFYPNGGGGGAAAAAASGNQSSFNRENFTPATSLHNASMSSKPAKVTGMQTTMPAGF